MRNSVLTILLCLLLLPTSQSNANEWNFNVFLDGKKVGTHLFEVVDADEQRLVQSIADFKVKILFFSAYSYQHTNMERWSDNCLLAFDAKTKVNGKRTEVSGETADAGFMVERSDTQELLPACVMTFAYWNPEFLKQERLLNPQTGEFLDVEVKLMGSDEFEVHGEQVTAQRYKITAKEIDLLVWYSSDNEWLGLESIAKTGHVIRYELS
jgi:hypothetical protein